MRQNRKTTTMIIALGMSLMLTGCKSASNTSVNTNQETSVEQQENKDSGNEPNNQDTDGKTDVTQEDQSVTNEDQTVTTENDANQEATDLDASSKAEQLFTRYIEKEGSYEDYLTVSDEMLETFRAAKAVNKHSDELAGNWNRTNCVNSCGGEMTLSSMNEDGFLVTGSFYFYGHSGALETGIAYFISDTKAVAEVPSWDGETTCLILMDFSDGMKAVEIGYEGFGFGANVSLDGVYTKGEAEYTNANALNENFTEDQQAILKQMFIQNEYDYDDRFLFPVQYGYGEKTEGNALLEDGSSKSGTWYNYFVPTMGGYSFDLFIAKDGMMYWQGDEGVLLSTDENAKNMPVKAE